MSLSLLTSGLPLSSLLCCRYANGVVYAFSSLILGYCVDHLNWPRTWLLVAANLLLAGMFVLEVRIYPVIVHFG